MMVVARIMRIVVTLLCVGHTCFAQGGLALMQHSVTFKEGERKHIVKFVNNSNDTLRYNISFIKRRMTSDGDLEVIADTTNSGLFEASPYLRVYPRTVMLPPGQMQSVALQIRRDASMTDGEYRTHLWFQQTEKPTDDITAVDRQKKEHEKLGVAISQLVGVSIPVFIHVGNLQMGGEILDANLHVNNEQSTVVATLKRGGNRSLRATLVVEHIPADGSTPYEIGVNSATTYRELSERKIKVMLSSIPLDGKLRVRIVENHGAAPEEQIVHSEAMIVL